MLKTTMYIGLNDKNAERQLISTETAKNYVSSILIDKFDLFAFTLSECYGVYKMASTGNIIHEKTLRIEIATDDEITALDSIIRTLKTMLNQETIMVEKEVKTISFE